MFHVKHRPGSARNLLQNLVVTKMISRKTNGFGYYQGLQARNLSLGLFETVSPHWDWLAG
jgi:hypothetical protein